MTEDDLTRRVFQEIARILEECAASEKAKKQTGEEALRQAATILRKQATANAH